MAEHDLASANFGPLGKLAGTWEGEGGVDFSFHHAEGETGDTSYLERVTLSPFGPVDNGTQSLYGLDYRMAAWRNGEEDPFHTEVGYWLYDLAAQEVIRCFVIPRGSVLIASGPAAPDATSFEMVSELGSVTNGILSNQYLDKFARADRYECQVNITDADSWGYDETTFLTMSNLPEQLAHTDRNRLRRVLGADL